MATPLGKKLGLRSGARVILVGAPRGMRAALDLKPGDVARRLAGSFDFIQIFVKTERELGAAFPKLRSHLREGGALWVSWPKGGGANGDLTLKDIIRIGYHHGLVESKTVSVDDTWSAIKFTFPKVGKRYDNSYGRLTLRSS
jgi:hypothetical protein